ncbi:MAG: hypothetical protein IIA27_17565 [Gemmatimonadetes bacterium]|nr:hypothetical protein [Gemmatimonadota bacterium]
MNYTLSVPPPATPTALRLAYPVAKMVFHARGLEDLRTRPAVLVYQMAKVASKTVLHSVRRSRPGQPVFHIHTLTKDGIETMERFYRWCRVPSLPWAGHLLVSRYLEEQLRRGVTPGRWKVITLVRDPIARNLSLLFHLGGRLIPNFRFRCDTDTLDPVAVFEQFERAFPSQVNCMRWFDDELRRVFDVNPFDTPFDVDAGYQVYPGPIAEVLLIRADRLNQVGEEALRGFLGLAEFRWKQTNIQARKANGRRYVDLLNRITLPRAYVDRFYDTPEVRHFFGPDELDRLRARWCGTREVTS